MDKHHQDLWSIWLKDKDGELHVVGIVRNETVVRDYMTFLEQLPDAHSVFWSSDLDPTEESSTLEKQDLRLYVVTKFTGPIHLN